MKITLYFKFGKATFYGMEYLEHMNVFVDELLDIMLTVDYKAQTATVEMDECMVVTYNITKIEMEMI